MFWNASKRCWGVMNHEQTTDTTLPPNEIRSCLHNYRLDFFSDSALDGPRGKVGSAISKSKHPPTLKGFYRCVMRRHLIWYDIIDPHNTVRTNRGCRKWVGLGSENCRWKVIPFDMTSVLGGWHNGSSSYLRAGLVVVWLSKDVSESHMPLGRPLLTGSLG